MKRLVFTARGHPELEELDPPTCPPDGMLLRTRYSALSNGTERNQLLGGNYNERGTYPFRPGYQAVSEVVEAGPELSGFAVGDLVYTGTSGTHAAYHVARNGDLAVSLPSDADLEAGAFLSVAAVSWHDVGRAGVTADDRVLVIGSGPIGQCAMQAVRLRGARLTASSRGSERLALAADINGCPTVAADSTDAKALHVAGPFDVVVECSGADNLDGILGRGFGNQRRLLASGGRLVLTAGRDAVRSACNAAQAARASIVHAAHYQQPDLEAEREAFLAGKLHLRPLIRDVVPARDMVETYEILRDEPGRLFGTVFAW